jgi:GH24 family phage-related lysozyme (muramidase)
MMVLMIFLSLPLESSKVVIPKAKSLDKIKEIEPKPTRQPVKIYYSKTYEDVINLLKKYEGFRSTVYDDLGYPCIGYGQRLAFFPNYEIGDTITKHEADKILRLSFNNHIKAAQHYFPGLTKRQTYAVAHMSYTIGIGNVIKAKYLTKINGKWVLNKERLYNYREVDKLKHYRAIRVYEYNLFNV